MHTDGRLPGASPRDQWQQGFLEVEFVADDLDLEPQFHIVPIQEGRAIYTGRVLEATGERAVTFLKDNFDQYNW